MAEPPTVPPAGGRVAEFGLSLGGRVLGLTKMVVTVNDHLDRLDKTDAKLEERLERLADKVALLATAVGTISGQLASIEKRLDDKDKLVAATIELEVLKATEKLRAEFKG